MDDEKAWDAGKLTLFSERIPSENNGLRDYEVRKMPVFNEQNQRQALVIIGRDITEHKRAEEKLQLSASVFTHASEAIMITTANATILDVNQAFTIITGYSRDDVLGKNPRILSAKKQNKDFYTAMWRELIEKGFHNSEIWNKRKNGEIYLQMLTISAVRDENGVILQYVSLFSDITQRRRAEEEIRNLAFYDRLTKLANRRLLMDKLRQALTASTRTNQYGAILFLDLDHFKILNDTLGHDYGDMMLIEVSHRIKGCLNEMDTVARLGGDEFAILLENIDEHEAIAVHKAALIAEKIRASLSISYQLKEYKQHGSPSIGMCMYRGDKDTADNLLKRADMAMYQVKGSGRNAVRLFDPAMQHALETRIKLEGELHHAIASNQLQLFYQIQVDSELRPTGAEALLRWMHPVHGIISPAEFISIAEESTLILDIGDWVLSCVCQQLALWFSAEKTRHLSLAVNVSARQFNRPDFVARLLTLLHTHKMDVTRLKIELTESVILNDVSDVIARMHTLREIGVVLSMDDFGTGYSSLSYLKQLPLDQIKIDQSFVRDMTCDPNDAVMVETIIDLAKKFRLNVIAEGVETHAQLAYIKQLGCMAYQGYLFSRPVPIEQFEALLQE
jgi:diguanylate cyclase (GGDEF)-like protein/PAS domain S-box-containing protein